MAEIITPAADDVLNERFTIYLDAEGKPVMRALGEMTADELFYAIWLHRDMAAHWEAAAKPFMAEDDDDDDEPWPGITPEEANIRVRRAEQERDIIRQFGVASELARRINRAALDVIPPEVQATDRTTPMIDLLRRYWPGGRRDA